MAKATKTRHSLILALLFLTLIASLGMLAMIVMLKQKQPTTDEIVATCARQAAASAATASQTISHACDKDADTGPLETVAPSSTSPGFHYPGDWSAMSQDHLNGQSLTTTTYLNPTLIHLCDGCDGPVFPITMATEKIDLATINSGGPATSFDDFATNHYYDDPTAYSNVTMTKTTVGTGTLYSYKGHEDALFTGDFETLIYQGPTNWVRVTYFDRDASETATNDAWAIVKGSLDFSQIP